jgi:hypothetical protein
MNIRETRSVHHSLILLFLAGVVLAACQPAGKIIQPTSTATETAAPIPSSTETRITPSSAPSDTPRPTAPDYTETPVPPEFTQTAVVIAGRLMASAQPDIRVLSTSPDQRWRAELVIYPCTPVQTEIPGTNAYDILRLVDASSGEAIQIADQLQYCEGLGAFGLGEIAWSANSQYYYYTAAREGSPDGGFPGWMRMIYRFELATRQALVMGPAELSPDRKEIAASEVYAKGQYLFVPLGLTIWDLNGDKLAEYKTKFSDAGWGKHHVAWSPVNQDLVYIEMICPEHRKCTSALYYVDRAAGIRTALLEGWQPAFQAVYWAEPDRLTLIDEAFEQWVYTLSEKEIEKK